MHPFMDAFCPCIKAKRISFASALAISRPVLGFCKFFNKIYCKALSEIVCLLLKFSMNVITVLDAHCVISLLWLLSKADTHV